MKHRTEPGLVAGGEEVGEEGLEGAEVVEALEAADGVVDGFASGACGGEAGFLVEGLGEEHGGWGEGCQMWWGSV